MQRKRNRKGDRTMKVKNECKGYRQTEAQSGKYEKVEIQRAENAKTEMSSGKYRFILRFPLLGEVILTVSSEGIHELLFPNELETLPEGAAFETKLFKAKAFEEAHGISAAMKCVPSSENSKRPMVWERLQEMPPQEVITLLQQTIRELSEYEAGTRQQFTLPLLPEGTPFQKSVWEALCRIPYGETRSYQEIAAMLGRPGASRAVGNANHHNPISILIPCHRVIRADGSLGGYGGGIPMKKTLLSLEKAAF